MGKKVDKTSEPPTEVRVTFRTYRRSVEKLGRVAEAENLLERDKPSVGKALNHVIDQYEEPKKRKGRST